ncbi:MAG: alpha-2-macroglobulin family protein [Parcubacteria group bacterium]|jgi:uncharacterized protein YfaS (alpha-2-macroglobulin family)
MKIKKRKIGLFAGLFFLVAISSTVILAGDFFKNKAQGSDLRQELFISGEDYYGNGSLISFTSKSEPIIKLGSYNMEGDAIIDVYRVSMEDVLKGLTYDKDGNQINPISVPGDLEKVASFSQYVKSGYDYANKSVATLPLDGAGTWLVNATLDGVQARAFIVRSDIGALLKEGDNKMIFWTQNLSTKKSLPDVTIKTYNLKDNVTKRYEARSNEDGIVETAVSVKDDVAVIRKGGDMALVPINFRNVHDVNRFKYFTEKSVAKNIFTFTDRPLYSPGDKVYFKSIIREDDDARYSIKTGSVNVEVFRGWGDEREIIGEKKYEISPDGTISGEFDLPRDMKNGNYMLALMKNKKDASSIQLNSYYGYESDYLSQVGFNVEYYQKPEYEVSVSIEKDNIISGDDFSFLTNGAYFSGQPTAGQEISYNVYASDFYEYSYLSDSSYMLSDDYRYGYRGGQSIAQGSAVLDDNGQTRVNIDSKISDDKDGKSQIYTIEVELKDASGNQSFDRRNVLVRAGEFSVYRDSSRSGNYYNKIGEEINLPLVVGPASKDVSLTAEITRTWWEKQIVSDSKYPKYNKHVDDMSLASGVTDSEGKTNFNFTPDQQGSYNLKVTGYDSRGNRIVKNFNFWVAESSGYYSRQGTEQGLSVTPDKEEYIPGESAKFTIYSETPDRDVFFSLERGRVDQYRIVHLKGNKEIINMPLEEVTMPNMFAYVGSFSDSKTEEATGEVNLSIESKKIKVLLTPDKLKYSPGDIATIDIKTTDYRDKPISSDLAVWLVDKALFELMSSKTGDIVDRFWHKRYDDTQSSNSLVGISGDLAEKGGGGDGAREIFKDTAYWNPGVHTDANGYAKISFKIPDNLTTWVLSGVATTRDTSVGQTTNELQVSKDTIMRPILPNILRVSDEVILSSLAQNFTDKSGDFTAKLDFEAGDVENASQKITLRPNETKLIHWRVHPNTENESAPIQFSLLGGSVKKTDIVKKTIPIRKAGFWDTKAEVGQEKANYTINLSENTDSQKAMLSLSLSSTMLGALPSSMRYLIGYPYGCVEQTTSRFVPVVISKENPTLLEKSIDGKNLNDFMEAGVTRLANMQGADGGWGWWGDSSEYFISSYVTEYLLRAKKEGAKIDDEVLSKARAYFDKELINNGYMDKELATNNIIRAYGMSLFGEKRIIDNFNQDLSPDIMALAVISNIRNGFSDPGKNGRDRLMAMAKTEGEGKIFWDKGDISKFGSVDASTGLALHAFIIAGGDRETASKVVRFLTEERKTNYWSNTFATVQVTQGLIDFAKMEKEIFPNLKYRVKLDGREIANGAFTKKNWEDEINIDAGKIRNRTSVLSIERTGEGHIYSEVLLKEFHISDNVDDWNNGIQITRTYTNEKGDNYSIGVGDVVNVQLAVHGDFSNDAFMVIEDQLPAGMVPINPVFKNSEYNWRDISFGGQIKELTENKVVFASNSSYVSEKIFNYRARVVSQGDFQVPPVTASLMYSPEVNGHSSTQRVQLVEKSEKLFDYPTRYWEDSSSVASIKNLYGNIVESENKNTLAILIGLVVVLIAMLVVYKKKIKKIKTDVE